ncbi:MAG: hypothetical protein IJZ54_00405 [Clostridia bacterium]|nr:hypothetical protein [Clostridia bacterium]
MNKKVYKGVEIEVCLFPRADVLVASGDISKEDNEGDLAGKNGIAGEMGVTVNL